MSKETIFTSDNVIKEYRKLLRLCKLSIHPIDIPKIRQAFTLANDTCKKQIHKLHTSLINQSLQVAQIVTSEIGLSASSIQCALLYKFIENNNLNISVVRENFGDKVADMAEDLAKISNIDTKNINKQAENFRKLLLTLTRDVRVILIKLADRLYTMRNLDIEEPETRLRIAHETFDLYAPIGHRLGLYILKTELEDLSMKYTNDEMYNSIVKKLQDTALKRNRFIKDFVSPITEELEHHAFKFEIKSRTKSVYSIWNKMQRQNVELEEIYDLFAIRIIINSDEKNEKIDCWRVFSIITGLYQPNPDRMRDWISIPKSNGYESLHTTVIAPGGKWVEVQIRSKRMDEIAEKGLAAHWKYKGQKIDSSFDNWLGKIREILETPDPDNTNVVDAVKLNLYSQEIFVFTPNGDLKMLPKGATALDFAYDIHSDVGNMCIGARVNGKNVPIRHILNNGDKVEILTSKNQKPKTDWIEFVITSKAKSKIKLALQEEKVHEAENGKEIFKRRLRNWKIPYNDLLISKLLKHFKLKNSIDFYSMIATELIDMTKIKSLIINFEKAELHEAEKISDVPLEKIISVLSDKSEEVLEIDEKVIKSVDYKLAKCCNPIFGDDIFGFVTISEGIKIHRLNCPNAAQMINRFGYRVVKARWARTGNRANFQVALKLSGENETGMLGKISDVITKDAKVIFRSINIDTNEERFEGIVKLFVTDVSNLDRLIHKLLKIKGINSAHRVEAV